MREIGRFFIRVSAFLQKEMVDVLRQPRLMLTLVVGPFLILLIFGLGFRSEARQLNTVFAVDEDNPLRETIQEFATTLGPQLIFTGFIEDPTEGLRMVEDGRVDLLVVVPSDIAETLNRQERPKLWLYHNEIDPIQGEYVAIFGRRYVDEVNRRLLQQVVADAQQQVLETDQQKEAAHTSSRALQDAVARDDQAAVRQHRQELNENVSQLVWTAGASIQLYNWLQTVGDGETEQIDQTLVLQDMLQSMAMINQSASDEQVSQGAQDMDEQLTEMDAVLDQFAQVSPLTMVSPFQVETRSVAPVTLTASNFYAPSVIVLLVQHLCVTIAGLSIVMEKRVGAMELFRVAPLAAGEVVIGKYLSLGLFAAIIGAVLTALTVFVLDVPMLGDWALLAGVMTALIFTSLGIGFIISLLSETTSQVVQYTMIVLLASVFFTDFFLGLEAFQPFVRVISWALPATYGNMLLRDIMLRGQIPDVSLVVYLSLYGAVLVIITWLLLRRTMRID